MAQGVPGKLGPRIFLTFGTTRVVGRQPFAPAAFTPGEIPGTHFQTLSRPQGTWFRWEPQKKSPVTPPGIDPGTSRLVAQCLNHYTTPGPTYLHNYLLTCLLTPWSKVLLEKLTGFQPVKKFPEFYGTRRFIATFTSARHLSQS